ncbi:hypothetical protein GCM10009830_24480 [Glycomyces endophyticus]|uniref:Uncharacterized protein n=1 Tax=Glycomyces endophyticus TaxID=480996 RepID=A0ABN2GUK2_9ACTN
MNEAEGFDLFAGARIGSVQIGVVGAGATATIGAMGDGARGYVGPGGDQGLAELVRQLRDSLGGSADGRHRRSEAGPVGRGR